MQLKFIIFSQHYYASFAERKTGYRAKSPTRRMLRRGGARFGGMTTARHSPSFTATAEKKGWIVSKANKTGQFSIITTTPDVRAIHNYPTVYDGPPLFRSGLSPCAALLTILLCKIYS
jgi:hypothetical protein